MMLCSNIPFQTNSIEVFRHDFKITIHFPSLTRTQDFIMLSMEFQIKVCVCVWCVCVVCVCGVCVVGGGGGGHLSKVLWLIV